MMSLTTFFVNCMVKRTFLSIRRTRSAKWMGTTLQDLFNLLISYLKSLCKDLLG